MVATTPCVHWSRRQRGHNLQRLAVSVIFRSAGLMTDLLFCSRDVSPAVHGSTKPIFRRVEVLVEALVYMILRGDKLLLQGYNFMVKDPYKQSTRTSMPLFIFLYPWIDTSLLAHSNSLYQFAVSPPSTPSRKFKSGARFIKHFLSFAV